MYAGVVIVVNVVQTQGGLTKYFPILVGLHQGSIELSTLNLTGIISRIIWIRV